MHFFNIWTDKWTWKDPDFLSTSTVSHRGNELLKQTKASLSLSLELSLSLAESSSLWKRNCLWEMLRTIWRDSQRVDKILCENSPGSDICQSNYRLKQKQKVSKHNPDSSALLCRGCCISLHPYTPTLLARLTSEVNMHTLMSETGKKTSITVMLKHSATKGFRELICIQGCSGKMDHFKPFVLILWFSGDFN